MIRIAIGLGCRLGCKADAITALVHRALTQAPDAAPIGLFTIADKCREPGLLAAAEYLALRLVFLPREALRAQPVHTPSPHAQARFGVPSVAEAAALAGAGPGAVLLLRRIAEAGATCAIARAPS